MGKNRGLSKWTQKFAQGQNGKEMDRIILYSMWKQINCISEHLINNQFLKQQWLVSSSVQGNGQWLPEGHLGKNNEETYLYPEIPLRNIDEDRSECHLFPIFLHILSRKTSYFIKNSDHLNVSNQRWITNKKMNLLLSKYAHKWKVSNWSNVIWNN